MKSAICTTLSLFGVSCFASAFGFAGRPTLAGTSTVKPRLWQYLRKVGNETLSNFPCSSMKPVSQIESIRAASTRAAATTAEFTALRSAFFSDRSKAPATESKGNFAANITPPRPSRATHQQKTLSGRGRATTRAVGRFGVVFRISPPLPRRVWFRMLF